jgi:C-terminal processing protease CtpA/Prc
MKADLDYIVEHLRNVHPATYNGFSKEQENIINEAYLQIDKPTSILDFYFVVNPILCSFNDGHTHLYPLMTPDTRRLQTPIIWLQDGYYIESDQKPFRQGDRIVAVGGKNLEALSHNLHRWIPAENDLYRSFKMAEFLCREESLHHLGVIETNSVTIRVNRAGQEMDLVAQLKPLGANNQDKPSRPPLGYHIDPELSLGIFYLDECHPDQQYIKTVNDFFNAVSLHGIRHIAIDVRHNGGGNSGGIKIFLNYIDVNSYKGVNADIRYSKEAANARSYNKTDGYHHGDAYVVTNKKVSDKNLLFSGQLYVMTSPQTFSSANWFAVYVRDNNLGTVIGEPTGNAPTSFGDILSFRAPNSHLRFSVSHKKWNRPDPDNDPENALYPDIPIYTTIEDIVTGNDPQMQELNKIIANQRVDPTVKTPVESGKVQGTAGYP